MRTSTMLLALVSMFANGGCAMGFVPTDLESPTPYAAHWVKNGVMTEARRDDSWACGAARTALAADHVAFSAEQLRRERHPHELWIPRKANQRVGGLHEKQGLPL